MCQNAREIGRRQASRLNNIPSGNVQSRGQLAGSTDATLVTTSAAPTARLFRLAAKCRRDPAGATVGLILVCLALRLAFAAMLGLGFDESYTVATARTLQTSYFDHPPLSWWLTTAAMRLSDSEAPIVLRLPFILLFALSTWLLFRLATMLFGARAGFLSALLFNLAPVFGLTTGSWVLPDGPLDCALLGAALCFGHALRGRRDAALRWWIGVGLCAGLALLSKYTAILILAGMPILLVTSRRYRPWLARPEPYLAAAIGFLLFLPVLEWNAAHDWVSFAFQGGRAGGLRLRPWAPIQTLLGETLFLLPWIGLPLQAHFAAGLWRGPAVRRRWLLCMLAAGPIIGFSVVALWARSGMLYHWAAPGYLFLLPLLGDDIARRVARGARWPRVALAATAILIVGAGTVVATEVRWNWLPGAGERFALGDNTVAQAVDWNSVAAAIRGRGLLDADGVVAGTNWRDAGKLGYAFHGSVPVLCLCTDAREFGVLWPLKDFAGRDVVIATREPSTARALAQFGAYFVSLSPAGSVIVEQAGTPSAILYLYRGHHLLPRKTPKGG